MRTIRDSEAPAASSHDGLARVSAASIGVAPPRRPPALGATDDASGWRSSQRPVDHSLGDFLRHGVGCRGFSSTTCRGPATPTAGGVGPRPSPPLTWTGNHRFRRTDAFAADTRSRGAGTIDRSGFQYLVSGTLTDIRLPISSAAGALRSRGECHRADVNGGGWDTRPATRRRAAPQGRHLARLRTNDPETPTSGPSTASACAPTERSNRGACAGHGVDAQLAGRRRSSISGDLNVCGVSVSATGYRQLQHRVGTGATASTGTPRSTSTSPRPPSSGRRAQLGRGLTLNGESFLYRRHARPDLFGFVHGTVTPDFQPPDRRRQLPSLGGARRRR